MEETGKITTTQKRKNKNRGVPKKGSWNSWLIEFEIGERRYIETTLDNHLNDMRVVNTPLSRHPAELKERIFTTNLFTAIAANKAGDIRYLLCIERTK